MKNAFEDSPSNILKQEINNANTGAARSQTRKNLKINIVHPQEGSRLCYDHELELIADLYREDELIVLDEDLSAVILIDGGQISHLFSGSLDCRLPSYVQNRSAELEVVVKAGDGSTLVQETVRFKRARFPILLILASLIWIARQLMQLKC